MLTKIPNGYSEVFATFGNFSLPGWEAKNIVLFNLPYPLLYGAVTVTRARCHKYAVDNFVKAFTDLKNAGLSHLNATDKFAGIYAVRSVRGLPSHPSMHSFGIAIDMDPGEFPLGSSKRMPQEVVDIWKTAGFFYGGDFAGRKDGMHFQLATGC